jgi:hypothetical protein
MLRAPMASRHLLAVALIAQALAVGACTRRIGSACRVSTDCSIRGERICDLSYLTDADGNVDPKGKGECTIEGCTPGSCPKEGACIQVFNTEFLSVACDPALEDRRVPLTVPCADDGDCEEGGRCDTPGVCPNGDRCDPEACPSADACGPGACPDDAACDFAVKVCTYDDSLFNRCTDHEICLPEGLCADISSVRQTCRKECNTDTQCREGYECRDTGSNGVYAAFDPSNPTSMPLERICMPIERTE